MRLCERVGVDALPAGQTLRPLRENIVIRVIDFDWSDILIETYRGKPVQGEVVAVGPGRYPNRHERGDRDGRAFHEIRESKHFRPTEVKVGDIVSVGCLERNGPDLQQVWMDGALHIICSEQWVAAVRDP